MKKYNLRLSDKFPHKYHSVIADVVEINGIAHGGVYVFKINKGNTNIKETIAYYLVQETIIELIEEIKL